MRNKVYARLYASLALGLLTSGIIGSSAAEPVKWKVENGGNDHLYDIVIKDSHEWQEVTNGIGFEAAASAANAMGGYLATPNLSGEALFIYESLVVPAEREKSQHYWVGAYCAGPGLPCQWITGDIVTSWGGYADIEKAQGDISYGIVLGGRFGDALQDLPLGEVANGFVVEFDPPDSEPVQNEGVGEDAKGENTAMTETTPETP